MKYCKQIFAPGRCPICGEELIAVDYYSAIQGDSSVVDKKSAYEGSTLKTTTTVSTQYSDIRKETGAMCLPCCRKRLTRIAYSCGVLFFARLLSFLLAGWFLFAHGDYGSHWVILAFVMAGIGILLYVIFLLLEKHDGGGLHKYLKEPNVEMEDLSTCFVKCSISSEENIPAGRTFLSIATVDAMKRG